MIDYAFPDSEDEEIEHYKNMMKQTKGRGITNPKDSKQSKVDKNMSDDEDDGRGYITLNLDKTKKNL